MRYGIVVIILVSIACSTNKPYTFNESGLKHFPPMPSSPENPVTVKGVELGRFLFYDPILSQDSSMSCSSCHKQKSAFSDAPVKFSSGRNGEILERNTPPLFNLAWYPALFWDGRAVSIEDQVFFPVRAHREMGLDWKLASQRLIKSSFYRKKFNQVFPGKNIDSVLVSRAIAQFERTLISCNSKYDQVLRGDIFFSKEETEGFVIINEMVQGDCMHCHLTDANAVGTILKFSNNGLDTATVPASYKDKGRGALTGKPADMGLFKIPSLRNVAITPPYMHDGRFQSLQEVLNFYSSGVHSGINTDSKMEYAYKGGVHLSEDQMKKVIAFLTTLTDSTFISNKKFSSPFHPKKL